MQTKKFKTSREVGEKIKKRRKDLGISQEGLAEILGVTYQQVQRYENGTNRLNIENIQLVADILSVPVSYFFQDDRTCIVAEGPSPYLPADEIKLLQYFRKIKEDRSKNIVLKVAMLAAKGKNC